MNRRYRRKVIILGEALVILAPFLVIAFLVYPVADDYNYGSEVYRVWVKEQNHSLASVLYLLKHAFEVTYHDWRFGRGEYSSFIFSCLMPSAFGNHTTWINAWLLIGISTAAIWKFVDVIFRKWLKIYDKYIYTCFPLLLFYVVSYMPSISQGYYWFNGAFYNLFITSVGMIYIIDCIYNVLNGTEISMKRQMGIVCLAWLVGGGNYASILVLGILMVLLLMYLFYDTGKVNRCYFKYFLPFAVFSCLNLFAPCNLNRTWETEKSYIKTIVGSLAAVPKVCGPWLIQTPLILLLLVIGFLVWNNMDIQVQKRKRIHPAFLIIITYLLVAAMICPILYAKEFLGEGRVYNVYYMIFVLLTVFDCVYTIRYIRLHFAVGKYLNIPAPVSQYSINKNGYLINILLIVILVGSMFVGEGYTDKLKESNIKIAYVNLLDGRVFRYRDTMEERMRIYAEHQGEEVVVPGLKEDYSLYIYYDLGDSKEAWLNGVVAEYYGVASITVEYASK